MKIAATVQFDEAANQTWDVVVVGAGPAGSLTARELARLGRCVLLVDKASFPRPKVCGCCISGSALAALRSVGLGDLPSRLGAVPLHKILLCSNRREAALPLPDGVALSRASLDAALVEEAIAAGAEFLPETIVSPHHPMPAPPARRSEDSASRLNGYSFDEQRSVTRRIEVRQRDQTASIAARIVVVADGLAGRLLAEEQPSIALANSRIGAGAIALRAPAFFEAGIVYMTCSERGYVGLVRLEDGRLDIAAALDPAAIRALGSPAAAVENILAETTWPPIEELAALSWRGTPPLTRRRCRLATERLFIAGDAAGYVEPFTGEGIAWALSSAAALAPIVDRAIAHWSPSLEMEWARLHRRLLGRRQRSCRMMALALRSRLLTRVLIGALSRAPALARPFLRRLNRTPALA